MNSGNVIDFAASRQAAREHGANGAATRDLSRMAEAEILLRTLHETKRLKKADQSALVRNLWVLVIQLDQGNPKAVAKKILEDNEWQKWKRYIRFPNEPASSLGRQAGSGGHSRGLSSSSSS
jgi:hypothetical protein